MRSSRLAFLCLIGPLIAADYAAEVARKRQKFELELREKDSPLSLIARRTVRPGKTVVDTREFAPAQFPAATVEWDGKTATLSGKSKHTLQTLPGASGNVRLDEPQGAIALHWAGKTGELFLRFYDQTAATRGKIAPRQWYPIDSRYRIEADWKPFAKPETVTVTRADGTKTEHPSPGLATFQLDGQTLTMRAIQLPDGRLFLPFKDKTAPRETYGAGRFLYAEAPKDGKVTLDFNAVNNPNCAFSPYWSCVLPLKENILPVRIPAVEKLYSSR
jgi:uncharacterized protein (DUF1684 family)